MVPNLIWAPDFFGPQEIWSPRNLVPKKFGPQEIQSPLENHYMAFSCRDQHSWGPNFSRTKNFRGPNEIGLISLTTWLQKIWQMFLDHLAFSENIKYIPCGCLLCIMCTKGYDDFCLPVPLKINKRHFYCFTNYQSRILILTNFSSNQNECFMFA